MGVQKKRKPPLSKRITKLRAELDTLSHAIREELDWCDKMRGAATDEQEDTIVSWIRRDSAD
jgi:hypothetical protein